MRNSRMIFVHGCHYIPWHTDDQPSWKLQIFLKRKKIVLTNSYFLPILHDDYNYQQNVDSFYCCPITHPCELVSHQLRWCGEKSWMERRGYKLKTFRLQEVSEVIRDLRSFDRTSQRKSNLGNANRKSWPQSRPLLCWGMLLGGTKWHHQGGEMKRLVTCPIIISRPQVQPTPPFQSQ